MLSRDSVFIISIVSILGIIVFYYFLYIKQKKKVEQAFVEYNLARKDFKIALRLRSEDVDFMDVIADYDVNRCKYMFAMQDLSSCKRNAIITLCSFTLFIVFVLSGFDY